MEQQNGTTIQSRPQVKKVSKPFYLWSYIGCSIGTIIIITAIVIMAIAMGIIASDKNQPPWAMIISLILVVIVLYAVSIYLTVITMMLLYKSWKAVNDGKQRTSPGKAVGFCFIPYFNFYWIFQAYWGYAKDYNAFLDRYQLNLKKLTENTFLAYCITTLLCIIPGINLIAVIAVLIYGALVINQQCDAINNLANVS